MTNRIVMNMQTGLLEITPYTDAEEAARADAIAAAAPAELLIAKAVAKLSIDAAAGDARRKYAPDWLVDQEYKIAYDQATTYIASGYVGAVPQMVQVWATSTGQTATWAANNLVATGDIFTGKLEAIRAIRLPAKYLEIDAATTSMGVTAALNSALAALAAL